MKKTILVLGDTVAPYHPVSNVSILRDVLEDYDVEITDDHEALLRVREFDLFVSYLDTWGKPLSAEQSGALKEHLRNGGKLLHIHSGISLHETPELREALGARFVEHPAMETLQIRPVHSLTEDLPVVSVFEEPYRYEIYGDVEILAEYEHEGQTYPAAWMNTYEKGTLIHLMPGHTEDVFRNKEVQEWLRWGVGYLCAE